MGSPGNLKSITTYSRIRKYGGMRDSDPPPPADVTDSEVVGLE